MPIPREVDYTGQNVYDERGNLIGNPVNSSRTLQNFQAGAGDASAILANSGRQAGAVAANTPVQNFNNQLLEMLKSYQTMGTKPFVEQQFNAQNAQTDASNTALLDPSLRGYAPSTIMNAGQSAAAPYNPTIQGAQQAGQTFGEQLRGFGDAVDRAQGLVQQFQQQQKDDEAKLNAQRDDARAVINEILTSTDPASLRKLNQDELTNLEQLSGYPKGFLSSAVTYKQQQADLAAAKAAKAGTGNSNIMTDNERALFNQFNSEPIVKDYNTILSKKQSVDQIIKSGVGGPGDLALVYEFMKGLDPTSVVRESEYESAAKSGNIFAGALARFNGYFKSTGGFLPPEVAKSFQSIVNSKLQVQTNLYNNVVKGYKGIATRQGLNPENVVLNYSDAASLPDVSPAPNFSSVTGGSTYVPPVGATSSNNADYQTYLKTININK